MYPAREGRNEHLLSCGGSSHKTSLSCLAGQQSYNDEELANLIKQLGVLSGRGRKL